MKRTHRISFSRQSRYLYHNIYHTLKCLFAYPIDVETAQSYFISTLRIALYGCHECDYLRRRFFHFFLDRIDHNTASEALKLIYKPSITDHTVDYVWRILLLIHNIPECVLSKCVIGIVNQQPHADIHYSVLFHEAVRVEQYHYIMATRIKGLGETIDDLIQMGYTSHLKRLLTLRDIVDRIMVRYKAPRIELNGTIGERIAMMTLYRDMKSRVMDQIKEEVAFRPGNQGAIDAMNDFTHLTLLR